MTRGPVERLVTSPGMTDETRTMLLAQAIDAMGDRLGADIHQLATTIKAGHDDLHSENAANRRLMWASVTSVMVAVVAAIGSIIGAL